MAFRWFLFVLALSWVSSDGKAQTSDSLSLEFGDREMILSESCIDRWDWERQNIHLKTSCTPKYDGFHVNGENWKLKLGNEILIQGEYGESGCSDCTKGKPLIMMYLPTRTVSLATNSRLFLFYFPDWGSKPSQFDWRINPLYNPILLDHLVKRNLIPAEYRLQCLLKWLGIPWKPMK